MNKTLHHYYLILECNTCALRVAYCVPPAPSIAPALTYLTDLFESALQCEYQCPKCEVLEAFEVEFMEASEDGESYT